MVRHSLKKPSGILITTPDDSDREIHQDTVQCVHCGKHWVVSRAIREAVDGKLGFCQRCNGITCGASCQACVPKEQQLENIEAGRIDWKEYRPIRVSLSGTGFTGLSR